MDVVTEVFQENIVVVYFFYGLAFFSMGLVVWLESGRSSELRIARAVGPLAAFGILHGLHEWFEMFQLLAQASVTNIPRWLLLDEIRIPHLVVSFLMLVIFGIRLIHANRYENGQERRFAYLSGGGLMIVWLATVLITRWWYRPSDAEFVVAVDVLARYMLGIPGAALAAWAIILEQRSFRSLGMKGFGRDLQWAAWAILLYGIVGQAFPKESFLFPSTIINSDLFLRLFGFPVQFFRATEAAIIAVFVIRALRAFDSEQQQRLHYANEARMAAQREALWTQREARERTEKLYQELQEREELLGELLHQVVTAQENERQRIARELHDGAGQILTGLGLGLAAARDSVKKDPDLAVQHLVELKDLNAQAIQELRLVIGDLRPSLLDDLGLVPALQAQVREFETRTGVSAVFEVKGRKRRLKQEVETIAFRITQEALNNIAKHAQAKVANVRLIFNHDCLGLRIEDDGRGFDPESVLKGTEHPRRAWGLLGMQERIALVGGVCRFSSQPGQGSVIEADLPIIEERVISGQN